MRKAERMEADGAKEGDTQVCAFMGISTSEREMSQLNLDGKVLQLLRVWFHIIWVLKQLQ